MGDSKGGPVYQGLRKLPDRALFIFAGLVYLFLYAPIMVLIIFSFNSTKNTQVWTGFSTQWYGALIRDGSVKEVTILSGPRVFHASVRTAMMQYKCVSEPGDVLAPQEFVFKVEN